MPSRTRVGGPVAAGEEGQVEAGEGAVWGLPTRRQSHMDAPRELKARRGMASSTPPEPVPGVLLTSPAIGGIPCLLCEPDTATATCVWFHGGGFRLGSAASSSRFGTALAAAADVRMVLVDYSLAPEHPFPAALHDAVAVYEDAVSRWGDLFVGGDSAGGNLAVGLTAAAKRSGSALPTGVVLLSPWCDLTVSASTFDTNAATDQLFSAGAANDAASLYLQGWDPGDPLVSPLYGDLGGFPPTLVFASTDEVLLDDARRLASRLADERREVQLHLVPGVAHVWPVLDPDAKRSAVALAEIAQFIRRETLAS